MGLSCGMKFAKTLMFIFNFIFWALGIAVLAVGIWTRVELGGSSWKDLLEDSTIPNAANLLIASGILVAIIGFFGCCGAIKENRCMLISYAILVLLIFIMEIATGIYAYTRKDKMEASVVKHLKSTVATSYGRPEKANLGLTKAVDWFQQNMKCCGALKPEDWGNSVWYKSKKKNAYPRVPDSCCKTKGNCTLETISVLKTNKKIHLEGCVSTVKAFVKEKTNIYILGGAGLGIGVIQLLGVAFSLCLCKAIKNEGGSQA